MVLRRMERAVMPIALAVDLRVNGKQGQCENQSSGKARQEFHGPEAIAMNSPRKREIQGWGAAILAAGGRDARAPVE